MAGYWELSAIKQTHQAWKQAYYALPPDACPICGQPLQVGYETQAGGGRLLLRHCDAGHYTYQSGRRLT